MTYIVRIESERVGGSLRTTPERLASACHGILRQAVKELTDIIIIIALKLQSRPDDAFFESQRLVGDKEGNNLFDLFFLLTGVFQCVFEVVRF